MNDRKIYTFTLEKSTETSSRVFDYQVPASSRDEALIKIGQTFNKEDEYKLSLIKG